MFSIEVEYECYGDTIQLFPPVKYRGDHDQIFFPKLGPKSWRDNGTLNPLLLDGITNSRKFVQLLSSLSVQQKCILSHLVRLNSPIFLYLFPWVDFTTISEMRFESNTDLKLYSFVNRNPENSKINDEIIYRSTHFAQKIASYFSDQSI